MQRRVGPIIMVLGFCVVGVGLFHGMTTGNVKAELLACGTGALLFFTGKAMAGEG